MLRNARMVYSYNALATVAIVSALLRRRFWFGLSVRRWCQCSRGFAWISTVEQSPGIRWQLYQLSSPHRCVACRGEAESPSGCAQIPGEIIAAPNSSRSCSKPSQEYQKFPLIRKDTLSKDAFRLVFKLPSQASILGLPIGQHVAIRGYFDDESGHHTVTRSYTPVSNNKDLGRLELVIKMYPDGQLTGKYLSNLQIGDEVRIALHRNDSRIQLTGASRQVEFRGPKGAMRYRKRMCKNLGMVAGSY